MKPKRAYHLYGKPGENSTVHSGENFPEEK